jgi:hypothetical protein
VGAVDAHAGLHVWKLSSYDDSTPQLQLAADFEFKNQQHRFAELSC